jgi:ribosomal protein L37E
VSVEDDEIEDDEDPEQCQECGSYDDVQDEVCAACELDDVEQMRAGYRRDAL